MSRRKATVFALALLTIAGVCGELAAQEPPPPLIVVAGVGRVSYMPDQATVSVEVRTEAETPQSAAVQNAAQMERVLAALRRQGHPSERITTSVFAVQPRMRYDGGAATVIGHQAVNAVTVRLQDMSRVGATLDTALAAGATRVRGVRFESTDHERLRRQALERAVAAARQDAEALARAAGGSLGALVQLSTEPLPRAADLARTSLELAASVPAPLPGGADTPVSPGEHELAVQVLARWRFVSR